MPITFQCLPVADWMVRSIVGPFPRHSNGANRSFNLRCPAGSLFHFPWVVAFGIGFIDQPEALEKILTHIGLWSALPWTASRRRSEGGRRWEWGICSYCGRASLRCTLSGIAGIVSTEIPASLHR